MDVGADHGQLSLYLSEKGHRVLAIENKKGPFEILSHATKMEKNIKVSLSDGISAYEEGIDCCVILGMGGTTIYEILSSHKEIVMKFKTIIIEPQSSFSLPIHFLYENGFYNDAGLYVYEKRYYPLMRFVKGKASLSPLEEKYGPYMVKNKDPLLLSMIDHELSLLLPHLQKGNIQEKYDMLTKEKEMILL